MSPRRTGRPSSGAPASRRGGARLRVEVDGCDAATAREVRRAARFALCAEGRTAGCVEIAVGNAARMRRLHKQWLGRSSDTDVLSFDLSGGQCPPYTSDKRRRLSVPPAVDGLVIVSRDAARRAARQRGVDWRAELILYVVHGCLHLIGYSDKTPGGFRRMHRREDALLTELGYGRVFDRPVRARIAGRKTARVGSKRRGRS